VDPVSRRQLLGRAGTAVAALALGAVPGCRSSSASQPGTTSAPRLSSPATSGSTQATGSALARLAAALDGDLVTRASPHFAEAKRLRDTRFDAIRPLAIAYCESADDVARSIAWARSNGVRPVARSGGHSYGGYSTAGGGLVMDVSRLRSVSLDAGGIAAIDPGAPLIEVYDRLASSGRLIPGGSCPTVGTAGLTLGGGHGFWSRKHGLTCDRLTGATVVTARGQVVECSSSDHEDLFWALRGGGGGNFGVVTELRLRTAPATDVATFYIEWPWAQAAAALAAWQSFAPEAPDELFSVFTIGGAAGHSPTVSAGGLLIGSEGELRSLLGPLASVGAPTSVSVRARTHMDAVFLYAGGCQSVAQCLATPRDTLKAKSDYANRPLSANGIATLLRSFGTLARRSAPAGAFIVLDSYGGAINRVPKAATAFVHRDSSFSIQYAATWAPGTSRSEVDAGLSWLRDLYAAMRPYVSGFAYQNYIDPQLANWQHAYYGANLARLVQVKRRYDADDVFRFRQSIPTSL
jgi:FAD/FMN-containing dehydrogenase